MSLRPKIQQKMELDDVLIKCVKSRPILYDNKRKEYKDQNAKNAAWRDIASETGLSGQDCMLRWRALRDRFVRTKKSLSAPSIDDAPQHLKDPWPLLDKMDFLSAFISHRRSYARTKTMSPTPSASSLVQTMLHYDDEPLCLNSDDGSSSHSNMGDLNCVDPLVEIPSLVHHNDHDSSPPCLMLNGVEEHRGKRPYNCISSIDSIHDEDELFCLSLVGHMKRLPHYKRAQAKIQVMQLLYELQYKQDNHPPL